MNPNVVAEEYLILQRAIMDAQKELTEAYVNEIDLDIKKQDLKRELPVLPQLTQSPVPGVLYHQAVEKIADVIEEHQPDLADELNKIKATLTEEEVMTWIKEAVMFDEFYFKQQAKDRGVSEWLPHFLAEQGLRPFMQLMAREVADIIQEFDVMGTCPCCGEPHRVAKLIKGEKHLNCPRCETLWKQKRLACVHCGNDKHEKLFYINVKDDESSKIEVCESCKNYLKVVDTEKLFANKPAALLDLETIHLDFVAQEEGYDGQ
ncbi:formate dehydrogenase accessory protein FdhE [Salisediminibacterium beveridgei]|uniref:FdhE-like protein n=1 Tax=Salisediminibacterium beveridgei TaxID=632773 RepID=A0A1D7QSV1_9BACI|nr:formate dehydrogenase accessory protein FdhE [Salisediminibacterium beveridgei]AOM82092.1 FdhE-like protein [Salisediminibacterium beveridgei]